MGRTLGQKITRNALTNLLQFLLLLPIPFIMIPIFIKYLGVATYGIWILVGTFIAYIGIARLNIGQALTKFASEYYAEKDYTTINKLVNTAFVIYVIIGLFIFVLFLFFLDWLIATFFHTFPFGTDVVRFVFTISLLIFVVNLCFSPFISIIGGLQRFDISNILNIMFGYLGAFGIYLALVRGGGLKGVVIVTALVSLSRLVTNLCVVKYIFPSVMWNPLLFDFSAFKKIFNFSLKLFISTLAGLANFQVDKIILSYFLGLSFVTFYQIGAQLVQFVRKIPHLLIPPIMPAASELQSRNDQEGLRILYIRTHKYVILLGLPIALSLLIFVKPFINLWLGTGYDKSIMVVMFFSICYFINIFTFSPVNILNGIGKPKYPMYTAILVTVLNIGLSILFVIHYGYIGVIYGTFISMIIIVPCFKIIFHRITNFSFPEMIKIALAKPLFAGLVAMGATSLSYAIYKTDSSFGILICRGTFFITLYIATLILTKHFDDFDRRILEPYLPKRILALLCYRRKVE